METPRSARRDRNAHTLTPTLFSRKKSLFGKDDRGDSDLGPITPLRFGGNRTNTKPKTSSNSITSFRNLFGNESPDSERSLSPDFATKYTNNGRYELLGEGHDKENQHVVDEETRFSFHSIPATPNGRLSAEESALLDESNSNSLSLQMSSDLNLIGKRPLPMLRTPSLMSSNTKAHPSLVRSLEPHFRNIHEHGKDVNVTTPDSNGSPITGRNHPATRSTIKARTALHFNDIQTIPTKSFYSSSVTENQARIEQKPNATQMAKEISPREVTKVISTKTPRQNTSMRKRSKSFSSCTPRLGQGGIGRKIHKPSRKISTANVTTDIRKGIVNSTVSVKRVTRSSKPRANGCTIPGGTKSCPTTPKNSEAQQLGTQDFIAQLQCVKAALEKGQHRLQRARALPVSRSMTDLSEVGQSYKENTNWFTLENEESSPETDSSPDHNRKFFRSRNNSRSRCRVYNHLNSISLVIRKGGKRKLIDYPHTPKRQRRYFAKDDFDFNSEQQEVDDLINRLDQGNSCMLSCNEQQGQREQQLAHEISSYQDLIDLSDDEPIPIQSNVIYVHHDDYVVEETEKSGVMAYDNVLQSNQTIIVRHDDESAMVVESAEAVFLENNPMQCTTENIAERTSTTSESVSEYYPIFYRERVKDLWKHDRSRNSADPAKMNVFHMLRQQDRMHKQRHGTGQEQYQIDAGQRAYGAVECLDCGLTYSKNEPEEELIHENFHRSQTQLSFAGWSNEHIASLVPEWDVTGRIIVVSQVDSKQWLAKIRSILQVVDSELGFATHGELPGSACIYLAIARSTVLGVCVVQPLQFANRMISIEGLHGVPIDCYSSEFYPAKCGISRIWVSPKYRRLGIARTLLMTIKQHYIFGYVMDFDEIAFGAPTESGKLFAESVTARNDFLVYL